MAVAGCEVEDCKGQNACSHMRMSPTSSLCASFVAEDVRVATALLRTCKNLFWRVSHAGVAVEEFNWILRCKMVNNLQSLLKVGRRPQRLAGIWSAAEVQGSIADRVVELARDVSICRDVRYAASCVMHGVWYYDHCPSASPYTHAVSARMDAVPRALVLSIGFSIRAASG